MVWAVCLKEAKNGVVASFKIRNADISAGSFETSQMIMEPVQAQMLTKRAQRQGPTKPIRKKPVQ
jgi:hypothetical protein